VRAASASACPCRLPRGGGEAHRLSVRQPRPIGGATHSDSSPLKSRRDGVAGDDARPSAVRPCGIVELPEALLEKPPSDRALPGTSDAIGRSVHPPLACTIHAVAALRRPSRQPANPGLADGDRAEHHARFRIDLSPGTLTLPKSALQICGGAFSQLFKRPIPLTRIPCGAFSTVHHYESGLPFSSKKMRKKPA